MKDRTSCILDGQDRTSCIIDNCSAEYEDDLMECGEFLDLMGLTKELEGGDVDIYMMAERIATLLGHDGDLSSQDEDEDEVEDDAEGGRVGEDVAWSADLERSLLLAGYTNCMDEALRFLVEEERYSVEHPVVQGLKQHLVLHQERVLQEAAQANNHTHANNREAGAGAGAPSQRAASCAIRPPSI